MARPKKANITQEDIGKFYTTTGEDIWKLTNIEMPKPEPQVTMINMTSDNPDSRPLSAFATFVRLRPEGELPQKKRKYTKHITPTVATENTPDDARTSKGTEQAPREKPRGQSKFDVTEWHLKTPPGDGLYQSVYGDRKGEGASQRSATKALFKQMNLPTSDKKLDDFLATIPECPNKQILVTVLKGEK